MRSRRLSFPVVLLVLLAALSQELRAQDTAPPEEVTFVIVHGAWGGGWSFQKVDRLLTERGHTVYRPTLTGLGERVHLASPEVDLSTHIDDVVNVLRFEELDEVVLVGHSYGGMVITGVADRVPERIRKLIYIDAFAPENGESIFEIQGEEAEGLKQMAEEDFIVPAWVNDNEDPPHDVPHPLRSFSQALELEGEPGARRPAVYIQAVEEGQSREEGSFFEHAERARERGWTTLTIDSDHNPQWSAPDELDELLHEHR